MWNFEIPDKPSVRTAFGISLDLALHFEGVAPGTPEARAMHERYYEMLVSHRMSPYELPVDILDPAAARYAEDPRVTDFWIPYRDDEGEFDLDGWAERVRAGMSDPAGIR